MKRKNRLTLLLILSSFIFSGSLCLFVFGYILSINNNFGLKLIFISFVTGLISAFFIVKYKSRIDIIIEYGKPVFIAAEHIKSIVEAVNIFGVEQLHDLIESSMKGELMVCM